MRPWAGWLAAIFAMLVTAGLVLLDVADRGFRRWWLGHALTTDTVSGLLVVLVTVLVVDQVVRRRQIQDRAQAVASQAAIMVGQAERAVTAVSAAIGAAGDRGPATDEVRTYMIMLLVGAPVLIDARTSRTFLEEAQHLGGEMARALTALDGGAAGPGGTAPAAGLQDAVRRLRAASAPLLAPLPAGERTAASAAESS